VNGQAEVVGLPRELLEVFSKRAGQVDDALAVKVAEFQHREGRDPTTWERAALCREASADTRGHKTGHGVGDLRTRWAAEAVELHWTSGRLVAGMDGAALRVGRRPVPMVTVDDVMDHLSVTGSTWARADVLRAICDLQQPVSAMSGHRWAVSLEQACDRVIGACVDLDPRGLVARRVCDGRSLWLEPVAPQFTSATILAEEERVLAWAMDAQADDPAPSATIVRAGLDVLQAGAAAAVAGADQLVMVVGPAGAGKTRMLGRAVDELISADRNVFGVAPTAKAARVRERDTGVAADTVAKLLHEWSRTDRGPLDRLRLRVGTTLIVDEAGMIGTVSLRSLVDLAERNDWRLALVGDPRQLQAVGRGGLFTELCTTGRVHELARLHRFAQPWEAAASLQLRDGNRRDLQTSTGEPVRNRDLWDVVATHPDGSLTVSHRAGHGVVTLSAEYAHEHVRLGYAATEHGNQADTVDVAIELVSTATTHRGLYVGATRGRGENRIRVITDTDDLAEARDVLETVLAHDRADIPAVTQRRELARHARPGLARAPEPASTIPDWAGTWRAALEQRRDDLVDYLDDRLRRRADAAWTLTRLQPALVAARAAWQPYRDAIGEIEHELRSDLRPAMWKANRVAMHARFGHHHTSARRAKAANHRVADAEARIAVLHGVAADVKQHIDSLEAQASNLDDLARPSPSACGLESMRREQLHDVDRLLDALDVWSNWAGGLPVRVADLTNTAEVLTDAARHAPALSGKASEIDRSQWLELLEPVLELLDQRSFTRFHDTMHLEPASPDLGIEL
jgi:hypothetical protein